MLEYHACLCLVIGKMQENGKIKTRWTSDEWVSERVVPKITKSIWNKSLVKLTQFHHHKKKKEKSGDDTLRERLLTN